MSALHQALEGWDHAHIEWLLEQEIDVNETAAEGNTSLMLAVRKNVHAEHARTLLQRGADVHARDRSGRTPLMLALDYGAVDNVELLLDYYAFIAETPEIDPDFEQGRLALLFALYNHDLSALHVLLDAGADPNASNERGCTPLMMAAELDFPAVANILLQRGADVNARETEGNRTALHFAAEHRPSDGEYARILLAYGAEVDARDSRQWTPLMLAAISSAAIVRLLLEHGANVHAEDEEGTSALSQAGWLGNEDTIRTLLQWGAGDNAAHLHHAFISTFTDNNQSKIPMFLAAGLKIGLSEAILLEDMRLVKRLLMNGVEQDELNRVLVMAASRTPVQIVRLLLKHGADPNAASGDQTALMQAYGSFSKMDVLLKAGADVNARDEYGETPFTMPWGYMEEMRLKLMHKMLRYGADVNSQSVKGKTALMDAARLGQTKVARFLLEHGAEINLRDHEGRTALMVAAAEGKPEMVRLLLEHGASIAERADDGSTALTLARKWVGKEIADILLEAGATI